MEEKFEKVKKLLKENGQEELLQYNIENNEKLLDQLIEVDFNQLKELYQIATNKKEKQIGKIEPIDYTDKEKLSEEEMKNLEQIGEEIIRNGKYAVITVAGGQRNKIRS